MQAIITLSGYFKACLEWSNAAGCSADSVGSPPGSGDGRQGHRWLSDRQKAAPGPGTPTVCAGSPVQPSQSSKPGKLATDGDIDRILFEIDLRDAPGSIVLPRHIKTCIAYMYGIPPDLHHDSACGVLLAAAFLDLPGLLADTCEWVFHNVSPGTAVDYLHFAETHELGPPGNSIKDAAITLIRRHAVELVPSILDLPLTQLAGLVMGSDAFFATEHSRVNLLQQVHLSLKHKMESLGASAPHWPQYIRWLGGSMLPLVMDVPSTLKRLKEAGWTVSIPISVADALLLAGNAALTQADESTAALEASRSVPSVPPPAAAAAPARALPLPSSPHSQLKAHTSSGFGAELVDGRSQAALPPAIPLGGAAPAPGPLWASAVEEGSQAHTALSTIREDWGDRLAACESMWLLILDRLESGDGFTDDELNNPLVKHIFQGESEICFEAEGSSTSKMLRGICNERQDATSRLSRAVAWQVLQPGQRGLVQVHQCHHVQVVHHTASIIVSSSCSEAVMCSPMNQTIGQPGRSSRSAPRSNWQSASQGAHLAASRSPPLEAGSCFSYSKAAASSREPKRPSLAVPLFSPPQPAAGSSFDTSVPSSTSMSSAHWRHLAAPQPVGCAAAALELLQQVTAAAIFQIRFVHMSTRSLARLEPSSTQGSPSHGGSHIVSRPKIQEAKWLQSVLKAKVQEATARGFDQLSFLTDDATLPLAVRCQRIPSARFGVTIADALTASMGIDESISELRSQSSDCFIFMGSKWNLDLKRQPMQNGDEMIAVYLRRSMASLEEVAQAMHPSAAFVDERATVRMAFGIRLCGGPGSPTINSIGGRSSSGKTFGIGAAHSWGWDNFLLFSKLTAQPWALGDRLRFMVTLTPL